MEKHGASSHSSGKLNLEDWSKRIFGRWTYALNDPPQIVLTQRKPKRQFCRKRTRIELEEKPFLYPKIQNEDLKQTSTFPKTNLFQLCVIEKDSKFILKHMKNPNLFQNQRNDSPLRAVKSLVKIFRFISRSRREMCFLAFLLDSVVVAEALVEKSKWLLVGEAGGERGEFKGERELGAFTTTKRVFGCCRRRLSA